MKNRGRTFLAWSGFASTLAILLWLGSITPSFEKCVAEHEKGRDQSITAQSHEVVSIRFFPRVGIFFRCQGVVIDENGATLTALATIAIAGFTLTLWLATTEQGRLTQQAIRLSDRLASPLSDAAYRGCASG